MARFRNVIYTCIAGKYDNLIQHKYVNKDYDYFCFTDNNALLRKKKVGIWTIKKLVFSKLDNQKNSRWHKTHPHELFPERDHSIWVDGNIDILDNTLFETINKSKSDMLIPKHNVRDCIYDECEICIRIGKDSAKNVNKMETILRTNGMPQHYGLTENNIIYRKHNDQTVIEIMNEWWPFIRDITRRDQLSLSYILWKHKILPADISIENARTFEGCYNVINHIEPKEHKDVLKQLFSISNKPSTNGKWHKVIYILGIKISLRNKMKEIEKKQKAKLCNFAK